MTIISKLFVLDSTLRDGAQGEGISFSVEDKLNITKALDNIGIDFIEAGNPGSNPKDVEFFEQIKMMELKNSKLVAFGSTRRCNTTVLQDVFLNILINSNTEYVSIFGKSWDMQVADIIRTTLSENINMIYESVAYAIQNGKQVIYDAEHFFDGYKNNREYALDTLQAAQSAGAQCIVLCDTNGGTFPDEIERITRHVKQHIDCDLGIHCHNDMDCACANTIAAVSCGVVHIQGTYIGLGERCGNTNLSSVIPSLQLKHGYTCIPDENMEQLTSTACYIAEVSNVILPSNMPYVGKSAFAHKGGMHVDGISKKHISFEHISPKKVGNIRHILLSELSGRSAVLSKLKRFNIHIEKDSDEMQKIIELLKELESKGYEFESADASFEVMVKKQLKLFEPFFTLEFFRSMGEQSDLDRIHATTAVIKIKVGEKEEISAAEGDGPVHALDKALRKALEVFYPSVSDVHLTDYKVRVLEPNAATAAVVRVLIESTDGKHSWTTVGASKDIIEASWKALVDSIEYKLLLDKQNSEK